MSKNDGGPAFPVQDAASWQAHGMTLRDYFAAKAMLGLMHWDALPAGDFPHAAAEAYELADAMLAQRDKEQA